MAVELARSITIVQRRNIRPYVSVKPNLKLIDTGKTISQKIAFEASMQRAQLNQKYWDDLLEKLRKSGGGGVGSSKFDRITVSMQLTNFLSNKTIQAMLRNLKLEALNLKNNSSSQINNVNQNVIINIVQSIGKSIVGIVNFVIRGVLQYAPTGTIKFATNNLSAILGILSFQLNKLKEILEEDLKELIKKLDVKGKIRNIKIKIFNTVSAIEDKLIEILELFGVLSKKLFTFN